MYPYNPKQISALKEAGESSGAKPDDDMSTANSSSGGGGGGCALDNGAGGYEDNDPPSDSSDDGDNESPFDGVLHGGHTRASGLSEDTDYSSHLGGDSDNGGVSAKKKTVPTTM